MIWGSLIFSKNYLAGIAIKSSLTPFNDDINNFVLCDYFTRIDKAKLKSAQIKHNCVYNRTLLDWFCL